jgi:hypothetical protein
MKLKDILKQLDTVLNEKQPSTVDEFIEIVGATPGIGNYSFHLSIVKYMGALQGLRLYVTARTKTHCIPGKGLVYAVMQGTEKFEAAGYKIEHEPMNP